MRRVLLAVLLAAGAARVGGTELPSDEHRTLRHGGLTREYWVHAPPSYDASKPIPLVLMLHGGGGPASSMAESSGMSAIADREGFLVAYPQGTGKTLRGKVFGTWNGGRCCGTAKEEGVDDVGFLSALIDRLSKDFKVDSRRVYVSGHSNGGIMAYRLAREIPGKIAAIAPVGAVGDAAEGSPARAVSILHIHGREDRCSAIDGGVCGGCYADFFSSLGMTIKKDRSECEAVAAHSARWRAAENCPAKAARVWKRGSAACEAYGPCRDGAEVALCVLEGQGHAWPGAGPTLDACRRRPNGYVCRQWNKVLGPYGEGFSASEEIWSFFRSHPR